MACDNCVDGICQNKCLPPKEKADGQDKLLTESQSSEADELADKQDQVR